MKSGNPNQSESNKLPSLKEASGSGYDFEDQVAAVFLLEMLLGRSPLSNELGILEKLERQASDWEPFGDILLSFGASNEENRCVGCSVKSNRPIRAKGATGEFSEDAWRMMDLPTFRKEVDEIAVFTVPLAEKAVDRLNQLVKQSRETDSDRLEKKIPHEELKGFHDSFRRPNGDSTGAKPGDLLRLLHHREFDFQSESSRSEVEAVALCQEALRKEEADRPTAEALWDALLKISKNLRISGGNETRASLSGRLRSDFPLRDDPVDVAEWAVIRRFSGTWKDEIGTQLAGGLKLPRSEQIESIRQIADSGKGFHVLGNSGSGKSALVKVWAETDFQDGTEVIWVKADKFAELLNAVPSFRSVAERIRRNRALLVFDGVEACIEKGEFDSITQTISRLAGIENSPWQIILTCQSQEWDRVSSFMLGNLGHCDTLTSGHICGPLSNSDTALVCERYPAVASLAKKPHLCDFILSPKVLDIIARGQLSEGIEIACEADLVDWWWREAVQNGKPITAEERVARTLAAKMADELTTELSPDAFDDDAAARELINREILRSNQDGRIRFDHELLADWSRTKHLRSVGPDLINFMREHSANPPWLRAIRILSQHFIEREADLEAWRKVVETCEAEQKNTSDKTLGDTGPVLDSWLDGIAFCSDVPQALASLEPDLLANDCRLLRRLIHRLFFIATVPHPRFRGNASEIDAEMFALLQRELRVPVWNIWKHFVEFLVQHETAALDHLAVTISEMVDFANRLANCFENQTEFWRDLGLLAILNAENELQREVAGRHRHGKSSRKKYRRHNARQEIYTSVLYASVHDPDRVARLVLKAAGRLDWDAGDVDANTDPEWKGIWRDRGDPFFGGAETLHEEVDFWQDGPKRKTSKDFAKAFFEDSGCLHLYRHQRDSTIEAILGFLIDWPKLSPRQHGGIGDSKNHGFQYRNWSEPFAFYTNGPFLLLLAVDFEPVARMIIRLVNFASERYSDWWPYENKVETLNFQTSVGEIELFGNDQVYNWGRLTAGNPDFVSSALMALEKHLELMLAKDEDISGCIELIFREGRSLAFAGLLVSLGKRHPDLFAGILSPLLFERKVFMFDEHAIMQETAASMGGGFNEPAWKVQQRRDWNEIPERRQRLLEICCTHMLSGHTIANTLSEVRQRWQDEAEELPEADEEKTILLRWASNFDPATWKETQLPNGATAWQQERPDELRDIEAEEQHSWHQNLMMLPFRCEELLRERPVFDETAAMETWDSLKEFKKRAAEHDELEDDEWASMFRDHRHSLSGFCAVLLCLCRDSLESNDDIREHVMSEVRSLLDDGPFVKAFTPDDIHTDGESFLARCAIQCLSFDVNDKYWRRVVGRFVTSYRYGTVEALFNEAHRVRDHLGEFLVELEALALSFASLRHEAETPQQLSASKRGWFKKFGIKIFSLFRSSGENEHYGSFQNPDPRIIDRWCKKWLPRFAKARGPTMPESWEVFTESNARIDQTSAYSEGYGRTKRGRRDYGIDMGVVLAAFGHYPALSDSISDEERGRWTALEKELLNAFLRTLPQVDFSDESEWTYNLYKPDQAVLKIIANRVFEADQAAAEEFLWPIVDLPPQAHQYVSFFFSSLFLRSLVKEPPETERLLELWTTMGERFLLSNNHSYFNRRDCIEWWRDFLFFGNFSSDIREACFAPIVEGLNDYYELIISKLGEASHDHVGLVLIFCSEAGKGLLVKSLAWFLPIWEEAGDYYWSTVSERSAHEMYLEEAWRNHFPAIRGNQKALSAFKILTLKLAKHQSPVALEIQNTLGVN